MNFQAEERYGTFQQSEEREALIEEEEGSDHQQSLRNSLTSFTHLWPYEFVHYFLQRYIDFEEEDFTGEDDEEGDSSEEEIFDALIYVIITLSITFFSLLIMVGMFYIIMTYIPRSKEDLNPI